MEQSLLVSIIVLTYNDFSGLEKSMKSIFDQEYSNIEVILSDDGSANYDQKMVEQYKNRADRNNKKVIVNHNLKNLGTVKNINKALEFASGDIIGFLGCGDYYTEKGVIGNVVALFGEKHVEVVSGKMKGISCSNQEKTSTLPPTDICKLLRTGNEEQIFYRMFNDNCFCAPATFYKSELYKKYGKYDERMRLIEDYPFLFKLLLNKVKIYFWDEYVTNYIFDGVSSKKPSPTICSDMEKIKEFIILPNIDKCDKRNRRLFLYNYYRKKETSAVKKILNMLKYPDQFIYWQYRRVTDIFKRQRRK